MKLTESQRGALEYLLTEGARSWVEYGPDQMTSGTATAMVRQGWIEHRPIAWTKGRYEARITEAGCRALAPHTPAK